MGKTNLFDQWSFLQYRPIQTKSGIGRIPKFVAWWLLNSFMSKHEKVGVVERHVRYKALAWCVQSSRSFSSTKFLKICQYFVGFSLPLHTASVAFTDKTHFNLIKNENKVLRY